MKSGPDGNCVIGAGLSYEYTDYFGSLNTVEISCICS